MQTILGANGVIATELAKELYLHYTKNIRLVSRNPQKVNETDELFAADLLDANQTDEAVKGSEIAYLTVGLPNDTAIWVEQFPIIMRNIIDACKKYQVKLVFFDNTYMYGKVEGLITEQTPFSSTDPKGKVRGEIAAMLLAEIKNKNITALIGRAPEFYGPGKTKGITNGLIFNNISRGKRLKVFLRDDVLRTLIFTTDASRAIALLGNTPDAYNQTWHLPCDNNRLSTKEFIALASDLYGEKFEYDILSQADIENQAISNAGMKEALELLPRYEIENLFDSSKFTARFPDFKVTSYKEGIRIILNSLNIA